MLAAASSPTENYPSLFRLALQMRGHERDLSPQLAEHIRTVVRQALALALSPNSIDAATLPDSIELAFVLKHSDAIRASLSNSDDGMLSAADAKRLLSDQQLALAR